ncbi:hypothetical protein [Geminisphaera colitermitum]|uniref:hypothetical protein n=1 Tax=Geminisphaera colitermitum TaxID=1148786 RepID=UPI0012FF2F7F|nr:hypothetical protein [Geminisphaera colitermitum]
MRANPGMYDAEHAAGQRVGAAVSQVGDLAGDFALKLQRAENFKIVKNREVAEREAYQKFQDEMLLMEPSKWEGEWQKRLDSLYKTQGRENTGKFFREEWDAGIADFKQRTSAEVRHLTVARNISDAKKAGENRMSQALIELDEDAWHRTLNESVAMQLVTPEDADAMRLKAPVLFAHSESYRAIQEDPIAEYENLKNGGRPALKDEKRREAINYAEAETHKLRIQTYDDLNARHEQGEEFQQSELDGLVERKLLTKTQAVKLTQEARYRASKHPDKQREQFLSAMELISNYDPATATPQDTANVSAAMFGLSGSFERDANAAWKEKRDPKSPMNLPVVRTAISENEENFKKKVYGRWWEPVMEWQTDKKTGKRKLVTKTDSVTRQPVWKFDPKKLRDAQDTRAAKYDRLQSYLGSLTPVERAKLTLDDLRKVMYAGGDVDRIGSVFLQASGLSPDATEGTTKASDQEPSDIPSLFE